MMKQYQTIKEQYPDSVLFFRLGDFYEMFFDDALLASKVLGITLTSRDGAKDGSKKQTPMCGVPHHAVDAYIAKMIASGYKVVLCDQVEDAKQSKGIVKRQVTRIITPGTVMEGQLLEEKKNNYIVALFVDERGYGLAFADISTGEFMFSEIYNDAITTSAEMLTNELLIERLGDEFSRLQPPEMLLPASLEQAQYFRAKLKSYCDPVLSYYPDDLVEIKETDYFLKPLHQQFSPAVIENLDLPANSLGLKAAGALMQFLQATQMRSLKHIQTIRYYSINQFMTLDTPARRNLELTKTSLDGAKKGSLLGVLDHSVTAMGGRMLKKWLEQPLLQTEQINARLDAVSELVDDLFLRSDLRQFLKQVYDLERLTAKVAYGTANARDLLSLKNSLVVLPEIKNLLQNNKALLLQQTAGALDTLPDLVTLLDNALTVDPPVGLKDGGLIKVGYDQEVDRLQQASTNGRNWLVQLEISERERTGIKTLKVRFNKVFGYYIEVTKSKLAAVPENYQRRQTLTNAERFIIPELKKYEEMILGAQDKLIALEYQIFSQLRETVAVETTRIQQSAAAVAKIDVLTTLAEVAIKYNYVRPVVNNSNKINIVAGRHPVVELTLNDGQFVPNDTGLDDAGNYIVLITGPNMGGKSTYQRQVGLITIMAQTGSFVPADQAEIGVVDRVYARVGATDDLIAGRSTFMVEMHECNNALRYATPKSLVIIDELGRGTSNLEGMAIAQAVIEYLHDTIACRTLFSTHYHELAEMAASLPGLQNYAAAVAEKGTDVVFLHRIIPGKASSSYGVHCAKLAGLPVTVTGRANQLVRDLEVYCQAAEEVIAGKQQVQNTAGEPASTGLFSCSPETMALLAEIADVDLSNTTPLEALNRLFAWQQKAKMQLMNLNSKNTIALFRLPSI